MNARTMNRLTLISALLCATVAAPMALLAQEMGGPPPILVINREFLKPGRSGTAHEKTEAAYIAASKAGKSPYHYLAMTSMSGPDRALFLSGFENLKAWEDENMRLDATPGTGAALDHTMLADGELLSESDSSVWRLRPEMSMGNTSAITSRYMSISLHKIKPGHEGEWAEAVKLVMAAYKKAVPEASWAMYSQVYGTQGTEFAVFELVKSLAEFDQHHMDGKKFAEAMGGEGMKKLEGLMASSVESDQENLFRFSPKMSIAPPGWADADPFWKPKTMMPAKKAEAKPAQ